MSSSDQIHHIQQVIHVREDELARIDSDIAQVRLLLKRLLENREDIRESLEAHKALIMPPTQPALERIPPEIWGLIFAACNEVTWTSGYPRPDPTCAPLLLTRICSNCRTLALEMPSLWSELCVPKHTDVSMLPQLETWLQRSGSTPLSIEIHGRAHDFPPEFLDVFAAYSSRWQNVALFLPNELTSALFSRPDLDLSSLSNLMIRQSGAPNHRIAVNASATRLRSTALVASRHCSPSPAMLDLAWAQLTRVSITSVAHRRLDDCFDVLAQCTALTHCALAAPESRFDSLPHETLRLAKLTSLQITSLGDPTFLIDCLVLPSLLQLEIDFVDVYNKPEIWPREEVLEMVRRSDCQLQSLILRRKKVPEADLVECCRRIPSLEHLLVAETAGKRHGQSINLELIRSRSGQDVIP